MMADGDNFEGWCIFVYEEDYNIVGQLRKKESSNDFSTTAVNSLPRR
jgi:hypothetical protein